MSAPQVSSQSGRLAWLTRMSRFSKRLCMSTTDMVVVLVALWLAFGLRLGSGLPAPLVENFWLPVILAAASFPVFQAVGMYRSVVRFMGAPAVLAAIKGATVSAALFVSLSLLLPIAGVPVTSYIIYWMVLTGALVGVRMAAWLLLPRPNSTDCAPEPALIYGAGMAGIQLAGLLQHGSQYRVVAFIDDDRHRQGTEIRGIPVYPPAASRGLVQEYDVREILLALPSVSRQRRRDIIASLEEVNAHVRTVPGLVDIVSGAARVDELRDVDIDDLLDRDALPPNLELLDRCIHDRVVLVTGAGGSIGSELCRQILRRGPTRLVLVDQSEYSLYEIDRELAALALVEGISAHVEPVLGDVLNRERLQTVMHEHGVNTVYHAAAYKHVPLVEANPAEGVRNNVFGTLSAVQAAINTGVSTFVLVSTDKAVNPTSVMGASKRVAELIVQSGLGMATDKIRLSMVRFGNVLDSSGSVVPLFRDQIRTGGPVTVTHPEVTRYLMTIPEAAQLVLQAGAMGQHGDVFVLDMGKPVRIIDLARRMIRLSGLTVQDENEPDGDIPIKFIGLRPGEKLYEELLLGDNVSPTCHGMISRACERQLEWAILEKRLSRMEQFCRAGNTSGIRVELAEMVEGFAAPVVLESDESVAKLGSRVGVGA